MYIVSMKKVSWAWKKNRNGGYNYKHNYIGSSHRSMFHISVLSY